MDLFGFHHSGYSSNTTTEVTQNLNFGFLINPISSLFHATTPTGTKAFTISNSQMFHYPLCLNEDEQITTDTSQGANSIRVVLWGYLVPSSFSLSS